MISRLKGRRRYCPSRAGAGSLRSTAHLVAAGLPIALYLTVSHLVDAYWLIDALLACPALLDDAARAPIMRERDGERFRLSRDEAIASAPDAEGARAMLAATAGSWADLDSDTMFREIDAAREAGSWSLDRP